MTIEAIRDNIHHNVGNKVFLVHNEGRNKVSHYEGRVIEVYRNIFIVKDNNSKMSFSYRDVLTKTVKVSFRQQKKCKFLEKY